MKQTILYLLILFGISASAQQFSIGLRGGLGTYSMDLLDQFQELRTMQTQLPLKVTESYPMTPFYRAEAALNDIKYIGKIALFYGYYSTGARSTVSDYSGRIDLDAVINGHQIGLTIQKELVQTDVWSVGAYADVSYLFSKLKTTDLIEIGFPAEITEKQEYRFVSKGFSPEPGLFACYRLKPLIFQINLGYQIDYSKKLHVPDKSDMVLSIYKQPVKPEWSGFRLGLQVSYVFGTPQEQKLIEAK